MCVGEKFHSNDIKINCPFLLATLVKSESKEPEKCFLKNRRV